jgi:EpsI family protein
MLEPDVERGLKLDDYILANYSAPDHKPVNLYVAYYASQREGESPHSPIVCLPGGGWQITEFERTSITDGNQSLPFNRVIIARDNQQSLVYYWFDERGRAVANEWWAKWYLFVDAITKNRTDAALVRLTTNVLPGETAHDADTRLRSFIQQLVPTLQKYLPSEAEPQLKTAAYRLKTQGLGD